MASIVFADPGSEHTQDALAWLSSANCTSSTTQAQTGTRSYLLDASVSNANMKSQRGLATQAGRRIQFWFYSTGLVNGGTFPNTFFQFQNSSDANASVMQFVQINATTFRMSFRPFAVTAVTGTHNISNAAWHEIVIAYHVTATNNFRFDVYLDGVLDITVNTGTLNSVSDYNTLQWLCNTTMGGTKTLFVDNIIVDTGTDSDGYTGLNGRKCTAKRPNANGATNNFDTLVTTTNSGYGTGRSIYINQRPEDSNGAIKNVSNVTTGDENFQIENAATGDIDITNSTIIGWMAWVRGGGVATDAIWNNGSTSVPVNNFTSTNAFTFVASTSSTYPSSSATIGMSRPVASATDAFLVECGIVIVYTPLTVTVGSSSGAGAASGVGRSTPTAIGSSAGISSAQGITAATTAAVGSSSGISTATGIGLSTAGAIASSLGAGAAAALSVITKAAVGLAQGIGAALGISASVREAVGNAAGTSTAHGDDSGTPQVTQIPFEVVANADPNALVLQIPLETVANYPQPTAIVYQISLEVIRPFGCSAPIPPPPCTLPPGCALNIAGGSGGGEGCPTTISGGSGSDTPGCLANMTDDLCP